METARNDGKRTFFPVGTDGTITLSWNKKPRTVRVRSSDFSSDFVQVTHDMRVILGGVAKDENLSDPTEFAELEKKLAELDVKLELDDPASRIQKLPNNYVTIMGVAGYVNESRWEIENGLAFLKSFEGRHPDIGPYSEKQAKKVALAMIQAARSWIKKNFPGFYRTNDLSAFEMVEMYRRGRKATIVKVKLGEAVIAGWNSGSYFGSGGAWGKWKQYGAKPKERVAEINDNGFCVQQKQELIFDAPGAVYTAAGDSINGGRSFYKTLIVAE